MSKHRKKKKILKPRATHVNQILVNKSCAVHEPKVGKKAKRAKQKENIRKELLES